MVATHYRWDFIGLSTDTKPTPETSEKVVDGSTFYCSDNSKLYVWCKNQWYEKEVSGGGGGTTYTAGDGIDITDDTISVDTTTIQPKLTAGAGIDITDNTISATGGSGPTVVQTTGTSTADVMSQNAVSSMVFNDPENGARVQIGNSASSTANSTTAVGRGSSASANYSTAVGHSASASGRYSVAIGYKASCPVEDSIAIGHESLASRKGEINVGCPSKTNGYNSSSYRVIGGVYDGQDAHDVATVAQGNTLATSAPTTSTVGVLGQLYTDTTNMHTYQCTAISGDTYTWTQRW